MNISSDAHKRENDPPATPRSVAAGIHEHLCEDPPTVEGETGRVVVVDLRTPGTIDVGLLREQRDWLLSLASAASPAKVAQLVKVDSGHLDGLVNMLDSMLDSAEGYPIPSAGLRRPAAGCAADCAVRAR
jgi:hypothetical protein